MLNKTDTIASLAKGLRVLECFTAEHSRLAIGDVSAMTGLDRATARRCLLTLNAQGYADYDGKYFSLTARALRLGMGALAAMPLPRIVQPWLDQLSDQIGQSCSVSILDAADIVYIARAAQRRVMSIGLMPGSRLPAHCTSMGRVLLSTLTNEEAMAVIEASDLTPRTSRSLTGPAEILDAVIRVRSLGYCLVDQEVELGLRSLAVPVVNSRGSTVAALNIGMAAITGEASRLVDDYLPALLKVQEGLRRTLG
ncbi:IclR family transcriptional regulator [Zhengella mangrovi]|uniref:IclR family transcriptional regulator n=1 Tax=Zhengella mangrovi TaxID=1982044 RepID=A0A2G1QMF1_9HYPH|nr:IclR family transcriptional regulator C-terminal domain-containing protein [Zhengella mangrovi]PHP66693.1 IclR family transcriptional regulator [Zhengella mangrovi]